MGAQPSPLFECSYDNYLLCSGIGGRKLHLTVRLPGSCVQLVGAEVAKGALSLYGRISKQNTFFMCFLGIWHLGTLLNPSWNGQIPLLPSSKKKACLWSV